MTHFLALFDVAFASKWPANFSTPGTAPIFTQFHSPAQWWGQCQFYSSQGQQEAGEDEETMKVFSMTAGQLW